MQHPIPQPNEWTKAIVKKLAKNIIYNMTWQYFPVLWLITKKYKPVVPIGLTW